MARPLCRPAVASATVGAMAIKTSGTSRSAAERAAGGRPNKLFPLATDIDDAIQALADDAGVSRAMVVSLAVSQLAERHQADRAAVRTELQDYAAEDKRRTAERKKKGEAP